MRLRGVIAPAKLDFDSFYAQEQRALVRLAHLLSGSAGIAEELAQEALLATRLRWDGVDNPQAYARRALVNLVRSHQRRRVLERRHEATTDLRPVLPPDVDETWQAIRSLPAAQRAVVVLRYYEDLTVPAIAQVLDRPVGTVKSLLHRAHQQLKDVLR